MIEVRGCAFPSDRYYHAHYNVWVQRTADGTALLGATSYGAALAIEFFSFVPKAVGTVIDAGRAAGVLELSKTVVSVRSPITGVIVEVNTEAVTRPSIISDDPYEAGWLIRLKTDVPFEADVQLVSGGAIAAAFEAEMNLEGFAGAGNSPI